MRILNIRVFWMFWEQYRYSWGHPSNKFTMWRSPIPISVHKIYQKRHFCGLFREISVETVFVKIKILRKRRVVWGIYRCSRITLVIIRLKGDDLQQFPSINLIKNVMVSGFLAKYWLKQYGWKSAAAGCFNRKPGILLEYRYSCGSLVANILSVDDF